VLRATGTNQKKTLRANTHPYTAKSSVFLNPAVVSDLIGIV
jgi:hypothetical protein